MSNTSSPPPWFFFECDVPPCTSLASRRWPVDCRGRRRTVTADPPLSSLPSSAFLSGRPGSGSPPGLLAFAD
eukprot:2824063-Pyramimonas_sp.AAC.1